MFSFVCVCMCVHTCMFTDVSGELRADHRNLPLSLSHHILFEAGSLSQTQSSLTQSTQPASSKDSLSSPSEAGVTGRLPWVSSIQKGSGDPNSDPQLLLQEFEPLGHILNPSLYFVNSLFFP